MEFLKWISKIYMEKKKSINKQILFKATIEGCLINPWDLLQRNKNKMVLT